MTRSLTILTLSVLVSNIFANPCESYVKKVDSIFLSSKAVDDVLVDLSVESQRFIDLYPYHDDPACVFTYRLADMILIRKTPLEECFFKALRLYKMSDYVSPKVCPY